MFLKIYSSISCYPRFIWRFVWVWLPRAMRVPFVYVKNCMFSRLTFSAQFRFVCMWVLCFVWYHVQNGLKRQKSFTPDWINKMPNNLILCTGHLPFLLTLVFIVKRRMEFFFTTLFVYARTFYFHFRIKFNNSSGSRKIEPQWTLSGGF